MHVVRDVWEGAFIPLALALTASTLCLAVCGEVQQYSWERGPVTVGSARCPGIYCGRRPMPGGGWNECGACPRGWRANATSACLPCTDTPQLYDWLYLGFVVILALVLHWFCIDYVAKQRSFTKEILTLHLCALVEIVGAAVATLLLCEPVGSLSIRSCRVRRLADWYPLFFNPHPNYEDTLHCTHEAVYPLYTMVFIFYALSTLLLLLLRPWVALRFAWHHGCRSIYAGLNFLPILAVLQATCAGLLYYAFPYIVIVLSLVSSAAHFAFRLDQSVSSLVGTTVADVRNACIIGGHWLLHAYGILSVTQMNDPHLHGPLMALVPLPALFYIFTARCTDPSKLHVD